MKKERSMKKSINSNHYWTIFELYTIIAKKKRMMMRCETDFAVFREIRFELHTPRYFLNEFRTLGENISPLLEISVP